MSLADIITDPHTYLEDLFGRLEALNLDVSPYYLDHICYRVATQAEYDEKKIALLTYADLIIESMRGGISVKGPSIIPFPSSPLHAANVICL